MDVSKFGLVPSHKCAYEPGAKSGRWTLLGFGRKPHSEITFAVAQCSCGSPPRLVRLGNITQGLSTNCGCIRRENLTTHGVASRKGGKRRTTYRVWQNMMDRCYTTDHEAYPRYGGRGIAVCQRWHEVRNFIADMEPSYSRGLTLERSDNDGGYSPANCRWATRSEQTRNRRTTVFLTYVGQTKSLGEWAELLGLPYRLVHQRLNAGWTVERALSQRARKYHEGESGS